jgi:hypothetical protein
VARGRHRHCRQHRLRRHLELELRHHPGQPRTLCQIDFDLTDDGTQPSTACPGCDFEWNVEISNSTAVAGDCYSLLAWSDGQADGSVYGYGFAPTYSYGSYNFTDVMMYYSSGYAQWFPVTDDATYVGDQFDYTWAVGYYYY